MISGSDRHANDWLSRGRVPGAEGLDLDHAYKAMAWLGAVDAAGRNTAEDVYVGAFSNVDIDGKRATFIVSFAAPGITVICRKISAREANPFAAPLSNRYDEFDGQMWLDEVFIPWERIFLLDQSPTPIARWLFWHQLSCRLSKAEFTLGLAFACTHAMGLAAHEPTIEYLIDLVAGVQTLRSCQLAPELDPQFTQEGYCYPNHRHVAAGSIVMLQAAADVGDPAEPAGLLLGVCTKRPRPRHARIEGWARGIG